MITVIIIGIALVINIKQKSLNQPEGTLTENPSSMEKAVYSALDNKNTKVSEYCISKKTLLRNLTSTIANNELFNEGIELPLAGASSRPSI